MSQILMNKKRIKEIFEKIKKGHVYWKKGDFIYKNRIEKAFDPLLNELVYLGVNRVFAESLLFFGKEFVLSLKNNIEIEIEDIEKIFNSKSRDLTDNELKELCLANKKGALIYQSLPMREGKVGIRVLCRFFTPKII